jgi:5-methyltetrahydropteroyltriglutamate--homocysteine methyltransferase
VTRSANLGFPRIGIRRELKRATEAYWREQIDLAELEATGAELRARHWKLQQQAGVDVIPSNDFSFYDQMLDMTALLGAVPERFGHDGPAVGIDTCFAMARGTADAPAMEMTKWFDTNYHYIVPELHQDQRFALCSAKPIDEFNEARALGIHTRPVLIGPVTYLCLSKGREPDLEPLSLLQRVLPVYGELLLRLKNAGTDWIQMDEPMLALDLTEQQRRAFVEAYAAFTGTGVDILLTSYFEGLRDNLPLAAGLPVGGLHIDLVRAPDQLDETLGALPEHMVLSLGLVDGRNVWRTDLTGQLSRLAQAVAALGPERVEVAPSCSLLHTPMDLERETQLDPEIRAWMAFARQKLEEVVALSRAADEAASAGPEAVADALAASDAATRDRRTSSRIHDDAVKARAAHVGIADLQRRSGFAARRKAQQTRVPLPPFATTTIGSFPQTGEIRKARAAWKRGELDETGYQDFLERQTEAAIRKQEALGLDVLVHGEFERNDMVEYFGERLDGFAFTQQGWVQSFGSRCVKPPVIFGDVSRPAPMTVRWSACARSLTDRPVKGMLTGPVTILQWSFVRDDQPRDQTCRQIALAIRDEAADLERAGLPMIQIDEPALREGLPLRASDRAGYLRWAVDCFRLASSGVADDTQIHTHMCYSEFNDIIESIAELDSDVISIETSRSRMALLDVFVDFAYPNDIGPGVWDIHSPRVPAVAEIRTLLEKANRVLPAERLWVNPDCGLKTRRWEEVEPAIRNMVEAARLMRQAALPAGASAAGLPECDST